MGDKKKIEPKDVNNLKDEGKDNQNSGEHNQDIDITNFVKADDFNKLKSSIDEIQLKIGSFGQPQQQTHQPSAPPVDRSKEELENLNKKIEAMNEKIDQAVYKGEGVGALMCERDRLVEQKIDLKNDAKFNEFKTTGITTLDRLSDQVVRTQMPHLEVPEIKQAYEQALTQMDTSIRMNPEVRLAAYHHAVGSNMNVIVDSAIQRALREDNTQTNDVTNTTGRTTEGESGGGIPSPDKVLSKDNLDAIRSAGKTVNGYYKSLGYDGWEDFYEKNKEYYEGEDNEQN